jgi:hypothetical protein
MLQLDGQAAAAGPARTHRGYHTISLPQACHKGLLAGRCAVLVVALRKLLPRRAEAFEAGLPSEGEDPLGDNIGLVQLVQVSARDGRGGPTEGQEAQPHHPTIVCLEPRPSEGC